MVRSLVVAVAAAALAASSAARAADSQVNTEPRGSAEGGLPAAVVTAPGAAGDEQFVTGVVMMTTPSEITIHTDQGMQRFALGPQMQDAALPAQGETVTLGYVPAGGTARVETIRQASAQAPPEDAQPATSTGESAQASAGEQPSAPMGDQQQEPQQPPTETSAAPATSSTMGNDAAMQQSRTAQHAARLPKTASDRPLIMLVGLLALAAAGVLRLAVRS